MTTPIIDSQKALLLLENYNICKPINNSTLSFFIGLSSAFATDIFIQIGVIDLKFLPFLLSIILLAISMSLNSIFDTKCKQQIHKLEYAKDTRSSEVKNRVKNKKYYRLGYGVLIFLSLISFCSGLYFFKKQSVKNTNQEVYLQHQVDSLKMVNCKQGIEILQLKQINDSIVKSNLQLNNIPMNTKIEP